MTCQTPDIVWMDGSGKRRAIALLQGSIDVPDAFFVLRGTHLEFFLPTLCRKKHLFPTSLRLPARTSLRGMLQRSLADARLEIRATDDLQPPGPDASRSCVNLLPC